MNKLELYLGDCLEVMPRLAPGSVDLVVTSPPYDNLRDYNGNSQFDLAGVIQELLRLCKEGAACVWIVGDGVREGSESGTSFRQALAFKDAGFRLHDTMIYEKANFKPLTHNRYEQAFEYMFVFSKGKPAVFNPIKDKPNKRAGEAVHGTWRDKDGTTKQLSGHKQKTIADYGMRSNIWKINSQGRAGTIHPATFPLQIPTDHILSWTNKEQTVLDPFMGSGTTGVACKNTGRNFIGIEKDPAYFEIAKSRIGA